MGRAANLLTVALLALATPAAFAARVGDVARLGGERTNQLVGTGLVVGLKGTGDGGDFLPAIRSLSTMLTKLGSGATPGELGDADNVAIVSVSVTVPAGGARDGDPLDVYVTSVGAAKSLKGGRLYLTPLQGPLADGGVLALATGAVVLEDPSTPTTGVVRRGATMEADLPSGAIEGGRFTLVLDDRQAGWPMASEVAKAINDGEDGNEWAVALDAKNVLVTVPPAERARPDGFVARVLSLPVQVGRGEARVVVNEKTGTMVITGDVEISPVVISHKGLTISTVQPAPVPTPLAPVVQTRDVVALDPTRAGGARLQDLVNALDQLKVPADDRIDIVQELHKSGKLHAKLIVE